MSIEYKILWVDDSPDWVESIEDSIKSHLEEKGYDPQIELKESGDNLDASKLTEVDLIIIDFRLPNVNGDELIKEIRNKECLTEIVLYSQEAVTLSEHFDGIFYASRDEAEELIQKVIDRTINKAQDITLIRGFIIAEAIDVEIILEECMARVFGDKGELFTEKVINAKPAIFSANEKYVFVKREIEGLIKREQANQANTKELKDIENVMKKIPDEVIEPRNVLAHSKKKVNDDGSITLEGINRKNRKTREINFSQEWLSQTRKNIAKHKENLNKLKEML